LRRITAIIFVFVLLAAFVLPVQALSSASANVHTSVSSSGECQVVITGTIHLEKPVENLTFPVPRDAYSVKLDGSSASTDSTDTVLLVDLSEKAGNMSGDLPFTITYTLSNVVVQTETGTQVQIPLLSGFSYPIDSFEYSVTLPGALPEDTKPAFIGGYQQAGIEKDMTWTVSGPKVSGTASKSLMDSETLLFILDVPADMFPRNHFLTPSLTACYIAMGVCAGLALLYWLLTMRCLPPRRVWVTTGPEGHTAGELDSLLTLQGANLTMMIFSWAQLGYVTISQQKKGRVLVQKHMEMGNERSSFERRCFTALFRKSSLVDTSTRAYALLRKKFATATPDMQNYIRKSSGNPKVFRVVSGLIALFCGASLGISLFNGVVLQWILAILLSALGFLGGWHIQTWAYSLFSLDKRPIRRALILCGIWLLMGLFAGKFGIALLGCLSQLLAGLLCAFGGLRTDSGRQAMSQVLGLQRYLRTVSSEELKRITDANPDYFHTVAPYALALGVDRQLASHMGKTPLPNPSYLQAASDKQLSAMQWSQLMRQTIAAMDIRFHRLRVERLYNMFHSLIKK